MTQTRMPIVAYEQLASWAVLLLMFALKPDFPLTEDL